MEYFLTKNQTKVPKLGFGTWLLKGNICVKAVQCALKSGYRHIDTAQIYGNEKEVGQAIKGSEVSREDVFLVTKVWRDQLHSENVVRSTEESLKNLQTDYVDLLLIHWPEIKVPLAESLKAMQKLVEMGKVKLIGVSNFPVEWVEMAQKTAPEIVCNQVEYHPFLSQAPVLKAMHKHRMFLTAYSPLARKEVFKNKTLMEIAGKYNKSCGQVTLRWLLDQENVVAIPKASKDMHIQANFDIFDFKLSPSDRLLLGNLHTQNRRLVDPPWSPEWDAS